MFRGNQELSEEQEIYIKKPHKLSDQTESKVWVKN